ncbi:ABC transporter permease [Desulfotignum phosphitoxidans]|uniref:Glutathione transport system permease protein GsiD n=1 Tax=Desulfotignum phosphitoxidans DSM 13687 TaxID=1286635 RepID=S0G7Z8_9BACT|nr:ABC transporter permease [Desulfotignum phosphitoxidans]EMS81326.1 glutathione transport system permease protein GsiD [Desulfotignum phosphitoxidans DSM 13687]
MTKRLAKPSLSHPFGNDSLGRCLFSRVIAGARYSLGSGLIVVVVSSVVGVCIGLFSGYFGGLIDELFMRVTDVFFAFPDIVLAMALAGIMGPGTTTMIFALSTTTWMRYARVVRAIALKTKQRDYVKAAKLFQVSGIRIIFHHILPPAIPAVWAMITLGMAKAILAVSALGFLGFGVSPPSPEWGTLLLDGKDYILSAPHMAFFPGMVIFVTVFTLNILGDRLAQSRLFMTERYDS